MKSEVVKRNCVSSLSPTADGLHCINEKTQVLPV